MYKIEIGLLSIFFSVMSYLLNSAFFGIASFISLNVYFFFIFIKKIDPIGVPLFILNAVFIFPRAILLIGGVLPTYELFYIGEVDNYWVLMYVCGSILFAVTYKYCNKLLKLDKSTIYSYSYSKDNNPLIFFSAICLIIGLIFCIIYIIKSGGIGFIIENYTSDYYSTLSASSSGGIVVWKNLSIYFLISGMTILLWTIPVNSVFEKFCWTVIVFLCAAAMSMYIKREYIFEVMIIAYIVAVYRSIFNGQMIKVFFILFSAIVMVAMFYVRSGDNDSTTEVYNFVSAFNTAEYWMLDQFIFVVEKGEAINRDYGERIIFAFKAPFLDFEKYIAIDVMLVELSTGIGGWGIPGTYLVYAYLIFGGAFYFISVVVFGALCSLFIYGVRWCTNGFKNREIYFSFTALFAVFFWFLFRNGDPAIAVFFTNRIFLVMGLIFILSGIFREKIKG